MTLTFLASCHHLPNAMVTGVHHRTWFLWYWGLNTGPSARYDGTPPIEWQPLVVCMVSPCTFVCFQKGNMV